MQVIGKPQMWREMSSDLDFENEMGICGRSFQEERNSHVKNQCGKHKIGFKTRAYQKEK